MMDDLLIKYIVGEASGPEQQEVAQWIAAHPDHRKAYERLYTIWQHSKMPASGQEPDVDTAWQRFVQQRDALTQAPLQIRKGGRWSVRAIAAALVLCIGLTGLWFYLSGGATYHTGAMAEVLTLPDQSVITLNRQSGLRYKRSFNRKKREVQLEGEAFFEVAKNPEKPFLIHVKDIDVEVVGTSFNIRSEAELTEIAVETGIVRVSRKGKVYTLKAQDKLVLDGSQETAALSRIQNQLYQYYRTNIFVCDHTPLSQVVQGLSKAYGVPIRIDNALLEQQHLTSKYPRTDSVGPILEKVALTLNASLVRQGNTYILK